jgi:hypothetical protein
MRPTSVSPAGSAKRERLEFPFTRNGKPPSMRRTFYAAIGWIAWKYGKRAIRRKLRFAGR